MLLVSAGTCVLIIAAFFRRWQQIRYSRYNHSLQSKYRPILANVLAGTRTPSDLEALRVLPLPELELLLDPLFFKRKLPERCLAFLRALCQELGLIDLWQSRLTLGDTEEPQPPAKVTTPDTAGHPPITYLSRVKSIRNLGELRHQPSWPFLVEALDDRYPEVQFVALRALAALGAPESFPALRDRLHEVAEGESTSPSLQGLKAAMAGFDLTCVLDLLPSLRHPNRQIRMHAIEILRTMVRREAGRRPGLTLTPKLLTPPMVELLLSRLAVDTSSEIRARAAEVIVFLSGPRVTRVLHNLLLDHQWFVRLHTLQALNNKGEAAAPLYLDIRDCLCDLHWRVREAAIQTLLSLGQGGRHQLYEHFLTFPDHSTRAQVVEVIERTGLISALVQHYSAGGNGLDARMVEELAGDSALLGLSGVLRTASPEVRHRFMLRFVPSWQSRMPLPVEMGLSVLTADKPPQLIDSPRFMAA